MWNDTALRSARDRLAAHDAATIGAQVAVSEIAAPTGSERARGAWMAERFRAAGLSDVRMDEAGNVIGRRPGVLRDERPVVLMAHLDTVFPHGTAVRVRRDGPRLIGPGIGDNGRGLAALVTLAGAIDGRVLRTQAPVDFVATVGEEGAGDLRGAKHVFAGSAADARAAIALDGAGDERIVQCALGSRRYHIAYAGAGGHSWTAYGVANALHAAAVAATKLARIALPAEPRTSLSVTRMSGGISVNAIPDEAWLEVDLRSTSTVVLRRLDREIYAAARAAEVEENDRRARGTRALSMMVTVIGDRPNGETPADHPLVRLARDATRAIGNDPELAIASTDANVPISQGIPAIAIGAGGRGGDAHTAAEWFENTAGHLGIARALAIVVGIAGLA